MVKYPDLVIKCASLKILIYCSKLKKFDNSICEGIEEEELQKGIKLFNSINDESTILEPEVEESTDVPLSKQKSEKQKKMMELMSKKRSGMMTKIKSEPTKA